MDTIFAQATAPGKAGVSIVRISGPRALDAAAHLGANVAPVDRKLCALRDHSGDVIDIAFVLSFDAGHSFTGERVVELHLHGSPAIVAAVQSELLAFGLRLADAGEFTRRAMDSGRIDLAQVEGLADLIDAETEEQRKQALRIFSGGMGDLVEGWRIRLIRAAALLEATIDFADEDVPENVFPEVQDILTEVGAQLWHEAAGAKVRERIRDGFEIGIIGPPNVGKSTLLNRLAGRDAAITSEFAGTTRDVIEVRMDLAGLPVTILDTAGIRDSGDHVEAIGIRRGIERAEAADLRVHLVEPGTAPLIDVADSDIVLVGKGDTEEARRDGRPMISGSTGLGVDALVDHITQELTKRVKGAGTATRTRHEQALRQGAELVDGVASRIARGDTDLVDLLAEDLRSAIRSLESLVGRIDVESLLDEIFSSFCIGK